MAKTLYSIYDKVAKEFGPVFPAKNREVAIRAFTHDIPREYQQNMKDFELFEMGVFEEDSGIITSNVQKVETDKEPEFNG